MRSLGSDNHSGVHPKIMEALATANVDHDGSYGNDELTAAAIAKFKLLFGEDTGAFFVYNGTGANVTALASLTKSFQSVFCSEHAHIYVDESTAPEVFTGARLISLPSANGKITAEQIEVAIKRTGDQHHPQAGVVSISQSTEYGTVYTIEELRAIAAIAKKNNLMFHMDGARIANAAVSLNTGFRSFSRDVGVDILSFGGTKNGLMFGEAVLVFNPSLFHDFPFIRKQATQLHSKSRFIGAQYNALLSNELWRHNATHANAMAKKLEQELSSISGIRITQPVESNAVFAIFPKKVIPSLQKEIFFYVWNESRNEVRLMCSFDTTDDDIQMLTNKLRELLIE